MKLVARSLVVAALVVSGSACGTAERLISRDALFGAMRSAGFTSLALRPSPPADADWIYTRGIPIARVEEMPIQAVRFDSIGAAQNRLANDQPLLQGKLSASDRAILPTDFRRSRLTDVRVCNVVVTSYNAGTDPKLGRKLAKLLATLRGKC